MHYDLKDFNAQSYKKCYEFAKKFCEFWHHGL